jgi:hypothetical protein
MAFTSIGSISASQIIATQQWPIGNKNIGPAQLPSRFSFGVFILDLSQVADLLANITVTLQVSLDGAAFEDVGGFGLDLPNSGCTIDQTDGVGLIDQFGVPFLSTSVNLRFPNGAAGNRMVRGQVSIAQAPAVIGATIGIW